MSAAAESKTVADIGNRRVNVKTRGMFSVRAQLSITGLSLLEHCCFTSFVYLMIAGSVQPSAEFPRVGSVGVCFNERGKLRPRAGYIVPVESANRGIGLGGGRISPPVGEVSIGRTIPRRLHGAALLFQLSWSSRVTNTTLVTGLFMTHFVALNMLMLRRVTEARSDRTVT